MRSFRGSHLAELRLGQGLVWLLETIAEAKGRQAVHEHQAPRILDGMREKALIQSVESSNRIEGVTVERARLRPLVLGEAPPRSRPEEEIVGYRRALAWVHSKHDEIEVTPNACQRLHALAQAGTTGDAGDWKSRPNDIIEILPDGRHQVRFRPLAPELVPEAMEELCLAYRSCIDQGQVTPLLALAALVLDFTCIHPFRDGNGRVSRLLLLLGLYHHGIQVGSFVGIERLIESSKEDYYDALGRSSQGWHEGQHDVLPWFVYFLSVIRMAYREFEERAGQARPARGSKTDQVEVALASLSGPFGIADVERLCPNVSREMIRRVMNRWRKTGKLVMLARGREARWQRVEPE